ncbi:hypothetical protein JB92DRAFT_2825497 [Gautieria morchelliformis]|nr:hypothetical protein JB92DRAFT_2825497 [Gautieria morchelliformis]
MIWSWWIFEGSAEWSHSTNTSWDHRPSFSTSSGPPRTFTDPQAPTSQHECDIVLPLSQPLVHIPPVLGVQPPDFKPHPQATAIFSASGDKENEHPLHSAETIEKQYKLLVRTSKPTGSAECPLEVEPHVIEHLINNRVDSGVVHDEVLDAEVIEISSDDSHKVFDPVSQAAHDDGMQAYHLETLHLHNLTSQLCEAEAEAEAWSLRKEVHTLQHEVD